MQTMQPALRNGRNVWDRVNMPESEFEQRLERIRAEMAKEGLDLLLLYGRGLNEYADPCYVSNFVIRLPRGVLAAVPIKSPAILFFEGTPRSLPSIRPTTCVKELKPANDAVKECANYLREKRFIPCTVGLGRILPLMPRGQFRSLSEALQGCRVVDAAHIVARLRMVKSPRECDQVRRAGRIVQKSFGRTGTAIHKMNEHYLEALARREARLEGAEDFRMLVARPDQKGWTFRLPEDREIEPGKPLIVHASAVFERYWAEGVRTFIAGESSLSEVSSAKTAFYLRALEALKQGKDLSEAHRDIIEQARQSGIELNSAIGFGGGIGLASDEAPQIRDAAPGSIEEGMCLTLRLAAKDREYGGVMLGNTLVVGMKLEIVTQ